MLLPLIKQPSDIQGSMPRWKSILDPLLAGPLAGARLLPGLALLSGPNTINHGLARPIAGYLVVLNDSAVTFFDSQSTNPTPELTLILQASGAAVVSLLVF